MLRSYTRIVLLCLYLSTLTYSAHFMAQEMIAREDEDQVYTYETPKLPNILGETFYDSENNAVPYYSFIHAEVIVLYVCEQGVQECDDFTPTLVETYNTVNANGERLAVIQVPLSSPPQPPCESDEETVDLLKELLNIDTDATDTDDTDDTDDSDDSDDSDDADGADADESDESKEVDEVPEEDETEVLEEKVVNPLVSEPWVSYGNNTELQEKVKEQYQVYTQPAVLVLGKDGSLVSSRGYDRLTQYGGETSFKLWKNWVSNTKTKLEDWINSTGDEYCSDMWIGNGVCDPSCAVLLHRDAHDCANLRKGCKLKMLGDGKCDKRCRNYATHEDYYDCYLG